MNKGFLNHIFTHFNVILLFLYASYKIKMDILFFLSTLSHLHPKKLVIASQWFYLFRNEIEQTCGIYFDIVYWFISTMKE